MKPVSTLITLFFVCAIFFFAGFLLYPKFYTVFLPDVEGIQYQMNLAGLIKNQEIFAAVISAVPLLLFLTWELVPLYNGDKKTLSVLIVLICMIVGVWIRYMILVDEYTNMVESLSNRIYMVPVSFDEIGFEWYLAGGLLAGCIITYLSFHNKVIRRRISVPGG